VGSASYTLIPHTHQKPVVHERSVHIAAALHAEIAVVGAHTPLQPTLVLQRQ
jgi:hypothetical protein